MSRFLLQFEMDNAAFDDDATYETTRILRHVALQVARDKSWKSDKRIIRDSNGNTVGHWEYKP